MKKEILKKPPKKIAWGYLLPVANLGTVHVSTRGIFSAGRGSRSSSSSNGMSVSGEGSCGDRQAGPSARRRGRGSRGHRIVRDASLEVIAEETDEEGGENTNEDGQDAADEDQNHATRGENLSKFAKV